METCVLIPSEFSLVLTTSTDRNANKFYEMGVRVWSNQFITKGYRFYPFQGTIRLDKLEVYSYLDEKDVSIHHYYIGNFLFKFTFYNELRICLIYTDLIE